MGKEKVAAAQCLVRDCDRFYKIGSVSHLLDHLFAFHVTNNEKAVECADCGHSAKVRNTHFRTHKNCMRPLHAPINVIDRRHEFRQEILEIIGDLYPDYLSGAEKFFSNLPITPKATEARASSNDKLNESHDSEDSEKDEEEGKRREPILGEEDSGGSEKDESFEEESFDFSINSKSPPDEEPPAEPKTQARELKRAMAGRSKETKAQKKKKEEEEDESEGSKAKVRRATGSGIVEFPQDDREDGNQELVVPFASDGRFGATMQSTMGMRPHGMGPTAPFMPFPMIPPYRFPTIPLQGNGDPSQPMYVPFIPIPMHMHMVYPPMAAPSFNNGDGDAREDQNAKKKSNSKNKK